MSLIDLIPQRNIPQEIAEGLIRSMNAEAERRVGIHRDAFNAFWHSNEATPQEIAAAMGTNAGLFFRLAAENVGHIARSAVIVGKTLNDYLRPEEYQRPKEVTINQDGTVTIGE